ncbi:lyase family protein [Bordetella sp. FB-8]|uniref:lyase family protein n=1 Tax=Bordetella sp. FB-8 TaxID=1159870 RepID=UPI00036B6C34|nr:lyase family protein [Bordetella sp. FB-8]
MFEHRDILDPCGVRARIAQNFSQRATIERVLQFEGALARVQAHHGVIPSSAAEAICARVSAQWVRPEAAEQALQKAGHPMVAILDAWSEQLPADAAEWIHYGTTTADVLRTIQFMQLRDVVDVLDEAMLRIEQDLASLAHRYRATPMIGRTLGRHAMPITFGFKVAVWLNENRRNLQRLRAWRAITKGGVVSGAVGTYSILGGAGPEIEAAVLQELGLGACEAIDIKGSFDRYAELGAILAICAKTYGKISQEIFILQGDDIRELGEAASSVGSSTMPHKSNPNLCIEVMAKSREVAAMLPVLLDWMVVIYERDSSHHDSELARICIEFGQLVSCMAALLGRLQVFPENMLHNISRTRGLVYAEALTLRLAPKIGRRSAHAVLHRLTQQALQNGQSLFEAIAHDPQACGLFEGMDLASVQTDVGQAALIVDRTLESLGIVVQRPG